jgi:hypothetical protein
MEKSLTGLGVFLGGVALIIFAAILLAWPVQLLWNSCLVDAVDGVHQIGFWQAMGLNFLFSILFKNSTSSNSSKK